MKENTRPSTPSMKVAYNKKNRTLESKEDFTAEYRSLILDLEDSIGNLEHYFKTQMEEPTVELTEDLNRLKLHRKKLLNMLTLYKNPSHAEWMKIRPEARSVFDAAMEAWQKKSAEISKSKVA
jgi:hypothetical protein